MMMLMHMGDCMQSMKDMPEEYSRTSSCRRSSLTSTPKQCNLSNLFDPSTLLNAAIISQNLKAVAQTLMLKPDLNNVGEDGMTPLTLCLNFSRQQSETRSYEIAKLLLTHGADPNICEKRSESSRYPLHIACHHGLIDIIDLLLEHDASPEAIEPHSGMTPLQYSLNLLVNTKSQNLITVYTDVVLALLQNSELDVTNCGVTGVSPLQLSILSSQPRIIMTIICKGSSIIRQAGADEAIQLLDHFKGTAEARDEILTSLNSLSLVDSPPSLQELSRAVIRKTMSRRLSATKKLPCPSHIKKFILLANFDWVQCPDDGDSTSLSETGQNIIDDISKSRPQNVQLDHFLKYC